MKLHTKSSDRTFKLIELFKVTKNLNTYCTLNCKESEIYIQVMDDSHVCLFNLTIQKNWFDGYEGENEVVSFHTSILVKILSLYQPHAHVYFQTNPKNDYLEITLKYKDNTEKNFQIPLIDLDMDLLDSQYIEGSVEFMIKTKKMDKYVQEMLLFGDTMEMVCYNDNIYMNSHGDDGKYQLKIPYSTIEELVLEEDVKLKVKIPLKYISIITKVGGVFDFLSIKIQKDAPFCISINDIDKDTNEELVKIDYYIAPKIEDDEELSENYDEYDDENYDNLENEVIS